MTIETKFNVNDWVWIMRDNKPCKLHIRHIEWDVKNGVYYMLYVATEHSISTKEELCFATKEQLIASL